MDAREFKYILDEDRTISVYVQGDTREEIEMAALDAARAFFGQEVRLEVIPVYKVNYLASAEPGHRGEGMILVREVV